MRSGVGPGALRVATICSAQRANVIGGASGPAETAGQADGQFHLKSSRYNPEYDLERAAANMRCKPEWVAPCL